MVVIVEMDKPAADVALDARTILALHRAEPGGLCRGCHDFAGSYAWSPCPQALWAERVLAAAGGGGDV
jgi:hypothetical protein